MNWTVVWLPLAEQELADCWLNADDRDSIVRAAHSIDQTLRSDPEATGESRTGSVRIHFERPLGTLFEVVPDDRTVRVITVWTFE